MAAPLIAASIAAPIVGGLIGQQQSQKDRLAAQRAQREAFGRLDALEIPEYERLSPVNFETLDSIRQYDPYLQSQILADPSLMAGISTDPQLRAAQLSALESMTEMSGGGLTDSDRFMLSEIDAQRARAEQGQRGAIDNAMRRRGISGSGMDLAMQLSANESAASDASRARSQVMADSQLRALSALQGAAGLAGNIRAQEFGEAERIAAAQDAINQFNTAHRRDVMGANTAQMNQAQLANMDLQSRQIAARNEANRFNQFDRVMANNDLTNQAFQNQFQRASGQAGALSGLSDMHSRQAAATQGMWGGIGQGAGMGAAAFGRYGMAAPQTAPQSAPAADEPIAMNYQQTGNRIA